MSNNKKKKSVQVKKTKNNQTITSPPPKKNIQLNLAPPFTKMALKVHCKIQDNAFIGVSQTSSRIG